MRGAQDAVDLGGRREDHRRVGASADRLAERRRAKGVGETREQLQVRPDARGDDREQRVHGLPVERGEVDRVLEEAERHGRRGGVQDDGIAYVRNRDAVADAGRSQGFPGQQDVEEELPVDRSRQRNQLDDRGEDLGLAGAADVAMDAAGFERGREREGGGGRVSSLGGGLLEQHGVDGDAARGRPFEQLLPVEPVLSLDAIPGQAACLDPAIDGFFRDREQLRGFAYVDLHVVMRLKAAPSCPEMSKGSRRGEKILWIGSWLANLSILKPPGTC